MGAAALLAPVVAAAALAAPPVPLLDVPFVSQPKALCGAAAAAMVARYWGLSSVAVSDFADLLGDDGRGLATGDLAERAKRLGMSAHPFTADLAETRRQIAHGRPLVVLVREGGGFHYVVVLGSRDGRIVFHDPARGPFRVSSEAAFDRRREAAGHWALLLLPAGGDANEAREGSAPEAGDAPRTEGEPVALSALVRASEEFRHGRWAEAADLAQEATRVDPHDASARRLLATSRFLQGRSLESLEAWNALGEPTVDLIRADGLVRLKPRDLEGFLGLEAGRLLTPGRLRRAERRLSLVPTIASGRIAFEPASGGRARVDVAVLERKPRPGLLALATDAAVRAIGERALGLEGTLVASGGETLRLLGQWQPEGGRIAASASALRPLGLPAVATVSLLFDGQAYDVPSEAGALHRERRRRASLGLDNWLSATLRGGIDLAADSWSEKAGSVALAGRVEQRLARDHVAVEGRLSGWWSRERPFYQGALRVRARTPDGPTVARLDVAREEVSANAPLALWPGAGTGAGRALLLRGHPLTSHGVVDGNAFGRALTSASLEVETSARAIGPVRLAIATFVDAASVARAAGGPGRGGLYLDVGAGLRIRLPGRRSALRIDVGMPMDGSSPRLSAGWHAFPF